MYVCILLAVLCNSARNMLHIGACANAALLTHLRGAVEPGWKVREVPSSIVKTEWKYQLNRRASSSNFF